MRIGTTAFVLCGLIGAPLTAVAAPPVARSTAAGTYEYTVVAGDTLLGLAQEYLHRPEDYLAVQRYNNIRDPYRLNVGAVLAIPRDLLRWEPVGARITSFRGTVSVGSGAARIGMNVGEGIRIATGANSSISLQLGDGSTVTLPSQSRILIQRLRGILISGEIERLFKLEAGKSQYQVKTARQPGDRFDVITPVAVAAVRGTEFRVSFDADDNAAITEVLKGAVGVAGDASNVSLPAGFGAISDEKSAGKAIALLAAPVIRSPVEQSGPNSLTFNIQPLPGAAQYHVEFAMDVRFHDLRGEVTSDKPVVTVSDLPEEDYYVRVSAISADGLEGFANIYPFAYHAAAAATAATP